MDGGRAHYIIESKVQWKPFWLATQQYPQNDWLGGNFPYTMTYAHSPHCCSTSRDVWTSWCTPSACLQSQRAALPLPRLLQIFINGSLSPDVQFRENEATGRGGGVYVDLASCVLSRHDHLAQGTDFGRRKSHCFLSILERNTTKVSNWYSRWSDFLLFFVPFGFSYVGVDFYFCFFVFSFSFDGFPVYVKKKVQKLSNCYRWSETRQKYNWYRCKTIIGRWSSKTLCSTFMFGIDMCE